MAGPDLAFLPELALVFSPYSSSPCAVLRGAGRLRERELQPHTTTRSTERRSTSRRPHLLHRLVCGGGGNKSRGRVTLLSPPRHQHLTQVGIRFLFLCSFVLAWDLGEGEGRRGGRFNFYLTLPGYWQCCSPAVPPSHNHLQLTLSQRLC